VARLTPEERQIWVESDEGSWAAWAVMAALLACACLLVWQVRGYWEEGMGRIGTPNSEWGMG